MFIHYINSFYTEHSTTLVSPEELTLADVLELVTCNSV